MKALAKYSIVLLLFVSISSCSDDDVNDVVIEASLTNQILLLVNNHRQSIGLENLTRNATADNLAINHSKYMIAKDKISHDNFKARADKLFNEENARAVGENVAARQKSAKKVMESWLNSSDHRDNIEGNFTHIGISAIKNDAGHYYYTQLFLRL